MNLNDLKKNWDQFGIDDPYWSILTESDTKGNKWNKEAFFKTGMVTIEREVKKIKRIQPAFTFHSALDFGCGAGRLTQALAEHFDHVSGVDIAPSMIKLATEKNTKKNCRFHLNEKNDLSLFANDEFDFVYSIITLQHMQPKYAKNYISEFIRVLKPNGILKFQIPSKPDSGTIMYHSPLNKIRKSIMASLRPAKIKIPIMEMYWIPIAEMVAFLSEKNINILEIKKDNAAGNKWDSFTYMVTKPSTGIIDK